MIPELEKILPMSSSINTIVLIYYREDIVANTNQALCILQDMF